MSTRAYPDYPDALKVSVLEKDKKSAFDPKSDLADKLRGLQKKHDAVDWKLFAEGWTRPAKTLAELDAERSRRDKAYGDGALSLKKLVQAVLGAAKLAEKAGKPLPDTIKSITKAANAYVDAIEKGADELRAAYDKAANALPRDTDDDDAEDATPSALVSPKLLLKQLTLCRKDPERRMNFAFVDGDGKGQPAMLALHPRMGARMLFAKLQAAAGRKAGAYGTAWVDGTSLMLQLDKPLSGLVKKVRPPVKACGFRIARAVLWNPDGTEFESDADADADAGAGGETDAVPVPGAPLASDNAQAAQALRARKDAVKAYLTTLPGDFRQLAAQAPKLAARADADIKKAVALAQSGDLAGALALLEGLAEDLAKARSLMRREEAREAVPQGLVAERVRALELAASSWQVGRMRSVQGLGELVAVLMRNDDHQLLEIASRISGIASQLPDALEARLDGLRAAVEAGGDAGIKAAKEAVSVELRAVAGFLKNDALNLRNCEANPFGVQVSVVAPLADALKSIQAAMANV